MRDGDHGGKRRHATSVVLLLLCDTLRVEWACEISGPSSSSPHLTVDPVRDASVKALLPPLVVEMMSASTDINSSSDAANSTLHRSRLRTRIPTQMRRARPLCLLCMTVFLFVLYA
ncbi:hypothetical protein B0T18DRAFT_422818 [Schizothecium vesticola]|uniref:Secreted protein n=1 Tax=Schizothecium vesticola TaxID=314040 RepID=A0AA40BR65_9PEZI|nr:hypothetical protein B0T18DRAFT_422818 [Schizothecium vesticola]